jgi:FkbM family methyltransferase
LSIHSDLVYDVGVYNGDDTAYYLFKGYRVLGIEADPTLVTQLQQRFASEISNGRLQLLNIALAPERGRAPFWICEGYSLWNSFDRAVASRMGRKHYSIEIECVPLAALLQQHGTPQYLKLSLHGHEHFCLDDLTSDSAPPYLSLEMLADLAISRKVFDRLMALGYRGFKLVNQSTQRQLVIRPPTIRSRIRAMLKESPTMRRAYHLLTGWAKAPVPRGSAGAAAGITWHDGWTFPEGSSGPFGPDTDGRWQDGQATWKDWEYLLTRETIQGKPELSHWYDLHASRSGT